MASNAPLDLEALERKLETDSRDLSLFWHRQFLGLIQRLREAEAAKVVLQAKLRGSVATDHLIAAERRIAQLEREREGLSCPDCKRISPDETEMCPKHWAELQLDLEKIARGEL